MFRFSDNIKAGAAVVESVETSVKLIQPFAFINTVSKNVFFNKGLTKQVRFLQLVNVN
jgi:hypothetical protein